MVVPLFFKGARHTISFFRSVFVIEEIFVHLSVASFCLWLKPFGQHSSIWIDACISAMAAMAGPHGHYDQDCRMIRWGTDSHGWRKSDGGVGSNDNWDLDLGCHKMCRRVTYPIRNCSWGTNFRGLHGGRYELNFDAISAKSYISRIRMSR